MRRLLRDPERQIDDRLREAVGGNVIERYTVSTRQLPAYRFVDLHRAVESVLSARQNVRYIDAVSQEDLNDLLHGDRSWAPRQIVKSSRSPWPVGADEEVFLPVDGFWVFALEQAAIDGYIIVRLRYDAMAETTTLSAAGLESATVEQVVARVLETSLAISVYRNQMLTMAYEAGTKDEYGDIEKTERLRVSFKVARPVSADDFVVDKEIFKTLKRNIIDLHQRRDILKAKGVPIRRGVLLYGPPGTGKTFACRYICGALPDTTRIVVAGTALTQVNHVFEFARTYQPSIVFLEDVDLAFASRDINLYSSALGDLLDQMDGLRPFEDISIVLTTNSIERMEAAIKDRPGRISQIVHFGAPERPLRQRYLLHYTDGYDHSTADIDALVDMSKGTTPAFIKEWVHRAVQIATERLEQADAELSLTTEDFEEAYAEMRRYAEGSTGRIVGFLGPDDR